MKCDKDSKENLKILGEEKGDFWYQKGLSFKCTECGKCCSGSPGYVWINFKEMQEIADHLKISLEDFKKKYIRQIGSKYSLKEYPKRNYDCIFLKDGMCSVYEVRPTQCRTYPFWPSVLRSKKTWENEARECEGIRDEHPKIPYSKIKVELEKKNRS